MATVTAEAPGKINLSLEILGKRADGYHELRSVVMPVSLFESVTVSERRDGAVTCETVGDGVDVSELRALPAERQLAVRAVRAMQRELGRDPSRCGCDIRVVKRVPIGAGMGGGSADAAGVLVLNGLRGGLSLSPAAVCPLIFRLPPGAETTLRYSAEFR